jgi:hypothetical protein
LPLPLDLSSYDYIDRKEQLFEAERLILKELGFSLHRVSKDNVHRWLALITKNVFKSLPSNELVKKAWENINTAYLTISVMSFPPNVVAAASLDLAINQSNIKVDEEW